MVEKKKELFISSKAGTGNNNTSYYSRTNKYTLGLIAEFLQIVSLLSEEQDKLQGRVLTQSRVINFLDVLICNAKNRRMDIYQKINGTCNLLAIFLIFVLENINFHGNYAGNKCSKCTQMHSDEESKMMVYEMYNVQVG